MDFGSGVSLEGSGLHLGRRAGGGRTAILAQVGPPASPHPTAHELGAQASHTASGELQLAVAWCRKSGHIPR